MLEQEQLLNTADRLIQVIGGYERQAHDNNEAVLGWRPLRGLAQPSRKHRGLVIEHHSKNEPSLKFQLRRVGLC